MLHSTAPSRAFGWNLGTLTNIWITGSRSRIAEFNVVKDAIKQQPREKVPDLKKTKL